MSSSLPVGSEQLHESNGDPDWVEVWDNWFVIPEQEMGGYVSLVIRPADGVSWYWASLVGFGRPLITIIADDAPLPKGSSMELRASGLWTETTVLRPFEHLTTDVEAFGVSIDDPTEVWNGVRGDRTAIGFELDWDTEGSPGPSAVSGTTGYRLVGRTHGDVLIDDARYGVEAIGVRDHWWGVPRATSSWRGWASRDGEFIDSDGGPLDLDLDDIVRKLPLGEVQPGLRVVGWAPVLAGGRRYARALVVGERGGGWFEVVR